jgi:orotate phosphoribosyltransferase-like protein
VQTPRATDDVGKIIIGYDSQEGHRNRRLKIRASETKAFDEKLSNRSCAVATSHVQSKTAIVEIVVVFSQAISTDPLCEFISTELNFELQNKAARKKKKQLATGWNGILVDHANLRTLESRKRLRQSHIG